MMCTQCPQVRAARRSEGLFGGAGKQVMDVRTLVHVRRIAATALVASLIAVGVLAPSASATPTAPACPDTVIANVPVIPNAVGYWNAIAVQATRIATSYQPQGLLYMGYIQTAVYDAVTKIDRRYVPYHEFRRRPAWTLSARRPTLQRRPRHTRC